MENENDITIYYVYILASKEMGALYIGLTSDLARRMHEHKAGLYTGFTKKYGINKLMHYETYNDSATAAHRELRLKKYTRAAKIKLIETNNKNWNDLSTA